ncbi:MAG TPA: NosD domain-containing protein [Bacteroidota bacterium]|jgi:parallel beta-helix repeat protein|nr:NosD domain-containing protein [Bacteroidota bacterium]
MKYFIFELLFLSAIISDGIAGKSDSPRISLTQGLVITSSTTIEKGVYHLPAPDSMTSPVITIRGDNITVDFSGAVLRGMRDDADPDSARGIAIRIEGGRDVKLLNAVIRGYKIAILAKGTKDLELTGNDVSFNWKPRLFSVIEHESLIDWLSFHHNEQGEWLRYGAGIYLDSVSGGTLRDNRCVQGMNGLLMTRCDHLTINDNDFSFNSGLGIGLYRSTDNSIIHNRLDYNVRGYSHRFYARGQDSADLLFFEQSSRNTVAYNSATHGGDGFFLWAGQTTMDSGSGGANDNLLYGNDFSYSPANGIEATFSRNTFVENIMKGCEYGIWGGYSYESKIVGNTFERNRTGVAIEHGQDNTIFGNTFDGDSTAISLWATPIQPSDWGYPKHRDTQSRDYQIEKNSFVGNRRGVKAVNTSHLHLGRNSWARVDTQTIFRDTSHIREDTVSQLDAVSDFIKIPEPDSHGREYPKSLVSAFDRSGIIVDEWGPYDYQSPKLWPADSSHSFPLRLRTLGPPGKWSVAAKRGIRELSNSSGKIGDIVVVSPDPGGDWNLTLEYRGSPTTSPEGKHASKAYRFSYSRFEPAIDWDVKFFVWNDSTDPRTKNDEFQKLLRAQPLLAQRTPRLDYEWYRPQIRELPLERFALEANGNVTLSPGTYTLRTISDDGVRVWVDDSLVIDNWSQHGSTLDYVSLSGGTHRLRVQFFQVDGWTEFRLDFLRGIQRSAGSPG